MICPSFTFYATAEAIARRGATPVFADIDPATLNLDPRTSPRGSRRRRRRSCPCTCSAGRRDSTTTCPVPIEDAAQAFGAQGAGDDRARVDLQLLPDEEPVRARRRRPRHDARRGARRADPAAPLPRLEGEEGVRARRLQLPARRDPGRRAPRSSSRTSRSGTGCAARPPRATRSSGSARSASCRRRAGPRLPRLRRPLARARPDREHLGLGRDRVGRLLRDAAPPQPALRFLGHSEGDFPETERASRENLALPLWAGIGADVQEQVVAAVREAVSLEAVR